MNKGNEIQIKNISLLGIIVAIVYFILKFNFNFEFLDSLSYTPIISIAILSVSFIAIYFGQKKIAMIGFMLSSLLFIIDHGSELLYNLQYLAKFYSENNYYPDHFMPVVQIVYKPLFLTLAHIVILLHSIMIINGGSIKTRIFYPIILVILVVCNIEYLSYYLANSTAEIASVFVFSNLVRLFPVMIIMKMYPPTESSSLPSDMPSTMTSANPYLPRKAINQVQMTTGISNNEERENPTSSNAPYQQETSLENNMNIQKSGIVEDSAKSRTLSTAEKIIWTIVLWIVWPIIVSLVLGDNDTSTLVQGIIQIGGTIYVWTRPKTIKK